MRATLTAFVLASLLALGCAAMTANPAAQSKCGNPCASVSCPSAFRCDVDANCAPRCQPEVESKH